jgi:hypothetical protein
MGREPKTKVCPQKCAQIFFCVFASFTVKDLCAFEKSLP